MPVQCAHSARVCRKGLSLDDYQTLDDARLTRWLGKLEQNRTAKMLDAHLIKPLIDDLNTRTLGVEGIEVTKHQFPQLNATVETCAQILHLRRTPRVFLSEHTTFPIATVNYSDPVIVIESSVLTRFKDPSDLRFLIGRELGHIQAGHVRWLTCIKKVKALVEKLSIVADSGATSALLPVLHWARASEMSADNAGAICAQDPRVGERVLVQLATGVEVSPDEALNIDAYLRQNQTEELSRVSEAVILCRALSNPVPFTPERIRQLRVYQTSERFSQLWK